MLFLSFSNFHVFPEFQVARTMWPCQRRRRPCISKYSQRIWTTWSALFICVGWFISLRSTSNTVFLPSKFFLGMDPVDWVPSPCIVFLTFNLLWIEDEICRPWHSIRLERTIILCEQNYYEFKKGRIRLLKKETKTKEGLGSDNPDNLRRPLAKRERKNFLYNK